MKTPQLFFIDEKSSISCTHFDKKTTSPTNILLTINNSIMKNTVKFLSLVIIMVLFSCSSEPIVESETSLQSVAGKSKVKKSTADVEDNLANIVGTSTIHRSENGITVNFKTNGLIPGNAYTMWFVIFDTPGTPPGPPTYVVHAAGHIVGGSGNGNFSAHLNAGLNSIFTPLKSEVHLALRTHGPAQPGMMPDQIQLINGGCNLDIGFLSGGGVLYPDSDVEGYCANIQVAKHPAID